MNIKKDYHLVTLIGFLVGWLVLLPFKNIGLTISPSLIIASVMGFTFFAPLAFWILMYLSRFWIVLGQFGKFAAAGTLNALLYLAILNLFIILFEITKGLYFSIFLIISFLISKASSYLWNKFWTFESKTKITAKEYIHFSVFTIIGMSLNVGIASFLVNIIGAPEAISEKIWANIAAVASITISFMWNFLSYRHIVFKSKEELNQA